MGIEHDTELISAVKKLEGDQILEMRVLDGYEDQIILLSRTFTHYKIQ